jgi:pantetheine-phosphate adenylyltransferase
MTIGLVSGSYDPITKGHLAVIKSAVKMVDTLYVAIARNADKGVPYFTDKERWATVNSAIEEELPWDDAKKVIVVYADNGMIVDLCDKHGATLMFRGLRNSADFTYEQGMQQFNNDFAPHISTVFLMPPPDVAKISSSAIRGLVGLANWEERVRPYVHNNTFGLLRAKQSFKNQCYTQVAP